MRNIFKTKISNLIKKTKNLKFDTYKAATLHIKIETNLSNQNQELIYKLLIKFLLLNIIQIRVIIVLNKQNQLRILLKIKSLLNF